MKRVRVHLHGPYAAFHAGPIEMVAATAWEAIEGVVLQVKGFAPDIVTGKKKIMAIGFDTIALLKKKLDVEDIHLMPALSFGKENGVISTIIGVSLIVVGAVLTAFGNPLGTLLIQAGITLTVGGVIQMLSPQPQLNAGTEDQVRSKYLPASGNTIRIGTTIGLLYGRRWVGGQLMSINIDAKDTGL